MVRRSHYLPRDLPPEDIQLIHTFHKAAKKINRLFLEAMNAGDKTKAAALYQRIEKIHQLLKREYGTWADFRLTEEYLRGAYYVDAEQGISHAITLTRSNDQEFGTIIRSGLDELGPVHLEAVKALVGDSKSLVYASIDKAQSHLLYQITKAQNIDIKQQLAEGIAAGDAASAMKQDFMKQLQERGVSGFRDRGGKRWSTERYSDMVVRTETRLANVQGTLNRGLQQGITTYKVIEHLDACSICQGHRNKVYDISKGSVELPPYHPNCRGYVIIRDKKWEDRFGPHIAREVRLLAKEHDITEGNTLTKMKLLNKTITKGKGYQTDMDKRIYALKEEMIIQQAQIGARINGRGQDMTISLRQGRSQVSWHISKKAQRELRRLGLI